jgi:predicted RNA binding protein YcfA (HicA-like mRNA interferase family)
VGRGKGAIPFKKIDKILKANGYEYIRNNGHYIYSNGKNTIAIPKTCCTYLIKRLFKENNIKEEI